MPLSDCKLLPLRKIIDPRGALTSIEASQDIPFEIKRIYYLYDIPGGSTRAGHAHRNLHQLFIAMSGSFDVLLKDGTAEQRYHMNRSYTGLYVPPMMWRDIDNFSSGSVCLVLASEHYDEADYIRNYPDYIAAVTGAVKS